MKLLRRWNWLNGNARAAKHQARSNAPGHRFTPRVEPLEDRRLLATLLGLTATNQLIRFDSATPGTLIGSPATITGLQAGENILGIDFRPANGLLYGLGSTSRLYTINSTTGAATQVGTGQFAVLLNGTSFGFDFNPTVDRIRVTSNADQNLRLNPDTAAVIDNDAATPGIQPDGTLDYPGTDANGAADPNIVASAYTNNFPGATTTTLFDIDSGLDILATQIPPNNGTLNTVGALNAGNITDQVGFDIETGTGTAFAALQVTGETTSRLFTINLTTGAATGVGVIGGTEILRGLAIVPAGTFQFGAAAVSVNETGATATITVNRVGGSLGTVTVNFATSNGTATAGFDYTATTGTLTFNDGETSKTFTVAILDDALLEGPETINLTLSSPSTGTAVGVPGTAVITISDNEAPALSLIGLTSTNQLVRFDSATPGTIVSTTTITGLQTGENILGIDFRPANGLLYGLGSTSRLYTINTTTGAATQVGTATFTPALSGNAFGFDFNPVPDRIRVTSDADQNLRLNPDTGAVAGTDTNLVFATGDPNAAMNPNVVAVAYTNNFVGAGSTTLYGIDSNLDILVLQGSASGSPTSPNTGQLTTVGALGVNTTDQISIDIAPFANTAFAVLQVSGETSSRLYTINLSTGTATPIGPIGGANLLRGVVAIPAGTVQFSTATFSANENAGSASITVTRSGGSEGTVTILATTSDGTATASTDYTATTTALVFNPGETTKTFTVPILDDGRLEGNETVNLTLSNISGGAVLGVTSTAVLTLVDDDQNLTANQRFVTQAFFDLLKRAPDPTGLAFFTNQLNTGTSRAQVAQQIVTSVEYRTLVVQNIYQTFLRRSADAGGLTTFVNLLNSGGTIEQVQSLIIGSDEYFQTQGGGTNDGFLAALYLDVLGRPIDPTGQATFSQALASGTTRDQVALAILTSGEFRQLLVNGFFLQFLGRAADPTGLSTFVNQLNQGARDEDIIVAIVGSDEYFARQLS